MLRPTISTPLNAVTATTTSSAVNTENANKITCLFTRANHSSGSSAFSVLGSVDGTTFEAIMLVKIIASDAGAGTAGEDIGYTRALSATLGADGSENWGVDIKHTCFKEIKVKVTETTDGTHTAKVLIERN